MKTFKFQLTGASPMLHCPMTQATLIELLTGVRAKINKDRLIEDIVKEKVILNEKGEIGIPANYLLSCLRIAGRDVKNGKKPVSTVSTTTMYGFLTLREEFLPFTHIDDNGSYGWLKDTNQSGYPKGVQVPWVSDMRRGVLKAAGKEVAVAVCRPKFAEGWTIEGTLDIDDKLCDPSVVKAMLEVGGRSVGLADFRPAKGGPFGRSLVTQWYQVAGEDEPEITEAVAATVKKNGKGRAKAATAGVGNLPIV